MAGLLGQLLFILLFAGTPVILVGLVDGFVSKPSEEVLRNIVMSALVIGSSFWISLIGQTSIGLEDLFGQYGQQLSRQSRLTALVGMEAALLMEFGIAVLIRWLRRGRE